jgi:DNA-binding response OmpR family regulator
MNGRVLILAAITETGKVWSFALCQHDLECLVVDSPDQALVAMRERGLDLFLITSENSTRVGIEYCLALRPEATNPILLLAPADNLDMVLDAYKAGVDEFVEAPVSHRLLIAKVTAWLRQSWTVRAEALESIKLSGVELDPEAKRVALGEGQSVKLTNLEFRVLHVLMANPDKVLSTPVIVQRV